MIFDKILTKVKKKNTFLFLKKLRYLRSRMIATQKLDFARRQVKFNNFEDQKKNQNADKFKTIFALTKLAHEVNALGVRVIEKYSAKFVGKNAELLLNSFLSKYLLMYKSWNENEKWGFFDMDLPEETKLKTNEIFLVK